MGDEIELLQEQEQEHAQEQEEEEAMEVAPSPLLAEPLVAPPPAPPPPPPPPAPPTDAAVPPTDGASKRQRRPNVRLNEIGDSSLANVVEYILKQKGGGSKPAPITTTTTTTTAAAAAPGKPSKKPQLSPKFDVFRHAEDPQPRPSKPFEKRSLTPKGGSRKPGLGKSRHPNHSITAHSKRPGTVRPRHYEGNGNSWMHQAMTGVADGFLEAADGCVYGCSDTDKHVRSHLPHDFEVHPAGSSFESGSPKGFRKIQAAKLKKKMGSGLKTPIAGYALKEEAEEKEEPLSSDVQELRLHGPAVWERGATPLDDQVRDWIHAIGLEKYSSVFQHHEVGYDVLPLLTIDDLKEMGISAVGARRKLFSEIMKLRHSLMLVDDPLSEEK